jgi:DNA-binding transcriptional ArsR family regulator
MKLERSDRDFNFKEGLGQSCVGKVLVSPLRLEILEVLARGERTVGSVATEIGVSMTNASWNLQSLHYAGLVESCKHGSYVHYRLGNDSVLSLSNVLRMLTDRRLVELERLVRENVGDRLHLEPFLMDDQG